MKRYCTSCGSPTEYIDKKPVFCSTCGKSFEKVAPVEVKMIKEEPKANFPTKINKITSSKINRPQRAEVEDIEDYIDDEDDYDQDQEIHSVPEIDNLEVEAESRPKRGQKLKDIVGTEPNAPRESRSVKAGKRPSKKQVLEDFAREAGSIRKTKRS